VTCLGVKKVYEWFNAKKMSVFAGKSLKYVDFNNMTHPIKSQLQNLFLQQIDENLQEQFIINLAPNNLVTQDTIVQFIPGLETNWPKFLSVSKESHISADSALVLETYGSNRKTDWVASSDTVPLISL
jgi:hypothetical protein